jgi:hypothetical protein
MFQKMSRRGLTSLVAAGVTIAALAGTAMPMDVTASAATSGYAHIFFIMMENEGPPQIIGNTADAPFINSLVAKYASAPNYFGVTHPSLPNYLALLSGSFQNVWDDCPPGASVTCAPEEFNGGTPYNGTILTPAELTIATNTPHMFSGPTLVDQLDAAKLSWKAYMESMPSVGYAGAAAPVDTVNGKSVPRNLYAVKHNPFYYFSNIVNNPARMQKIVPFSQFDTDLAANSVANFVWISPNQCDDMHGISGANAKAVHIPNCAAPASGVYHGPIQVGDSFLKGLVGKIMASAAWKQKSAILIAWDENDYSSYEGCCQSPQGLNGITLGGGHAPFIAILSQGAHHVVDPTPYNHYSLLGTIEQIWGLGCLNEACNLGQDGLMTKFLQ